MVQAGVRFATIWGTIRLPVDLADTEPIRSNCRKTLQVQRLANFLLQNGDARSGYGSGSD